MINNIYQNTIDILTSQGKFYINLGLERIQSVLELLGNPQKSLKVIHVAGTNGKGSVCAMLSSILTSNGLNTGLFTSPHVFEYTERIKINNKEISKQDFAKKILKIIEISEKNGIHLTEFEIITAAAFENFAENKVDIVILETGLGGRLDATNIISENICSVITHIDFDHTERLGNTIEKIAVEKAGIIKQNCPVVISKNNSGYNTIEKIAKNKSSALIEVEEAPIFLIEKSALKGTYQAENLALVLSVINVLNKNGYKITSEEIEQGLANAKHPCRFEYLEDYNLIIDGAHNPDGIIALRASLDKDYPNQNFNIIFGCLNNKDYKSMIKNLYRTGDKIYFYTFNNLNACSFEDISGSCDFDLDKFENFEFDFNRVSVICGSFYMIKELLNKLGIK